MPIALKPISFVIKSMSENNILTVAYILAGSNIDPIPNITNGLVILSESVTVLDISTHYSSRPTLRKNQPNFVNGVWKIETDLDPVSLQFGLLREIENQRGRERTSDKHAARTLDLDLLLFGNTIMKTEQLILPAKEIYQYLHAAIPLADIAPNLILPDINKRVCDLKMPQDKNELVPMPELTVFLKGKIQNEFGKN